MPGGRDEYFDHHNRVLLNHLDDVVRLQCWQAHLNIFYVLRLQAEDDHGGHQNPDFVRDLHVAITSTSTKVK